LENIGFRPDKSAKPQKISAQNIAIFLSSFFLLQKNYSGISTLTQYRPTMPSGNRKQMLILEDLFSSVLSQFQKYHPCGTLKFNN